MAGGGPWRVEEVIVVDRVDVAGAALDEESDRPVSQGIFDHLRSNAGHVGRVGTSGHALNGMACEVVDDGKRTSVEPVELQDADFGVDRSGTDDLRVGYECVSVAHVRFTSVLEFQSAVLGNAIFHAGTDADAYRHKVFQRLLDRLHAESIGIPTHDAVAVAGIRKDALGRNLVTPSQLATHVFHVVVADVTDLTDRHGIDGDQDDRRLTLAQDQRLGVHRVFARTFALWTELNYQDPQLIHE